jgi:hypothetical protein
MHMHTVPNRLVGATLGQAHKWVREQMVHSNPRKPMTDYTLSNENGQRISLSDLTRGKASHVTINGAGSVRSNPAHPAEITGFMEIPKPMHANRLTALTQNQITPALYNAMVKEFGLFGATQTLSILLTRPISPSLHHSQKTANLIRARKGETLLPLHRFTGATKIEKKKEEKRDNKNKQRNSRGGGGGRSNPSSAESVNAATALGLGASVPAAATRLGRAGMLNLDLDKTTTDIRREIDSMLDDAEDAFADGEAGALISVANRMSLRYENSAEIFDNFAQNVLAPYLISSSANINALKYINQYILPAMRDIIGSSDTKKRKLDRQYRYLVEKLATDPKDFYMGSELALIAHPAFLFPRAGLALMPVPETKSDMAFRAFSQIGTPPKWDPNTGFIMVADKSDKSGVAYLERTSFESIQKASFASGRNLANILQTINNFTDVIERYGETDSSGFNVLVRETRSMARLAGNQLYQSLAWGDDQRKPAFYFADLPGIRPIPTNWPQGLIMAMMEVLASNRDRITGLGGGAFSAEDFLTPSGINLQAEGEFGDQMFETYTAWEAERTRLVALPAGELSAGGPSNAAAERVIEALITVSRRNGIPLTVDNPGAPGTFISPLSAANPTAVALRPGGNPAAVGGDDRAMVVFGGANPEPYRNFAGFLENIVRENRANGAAGPIVRGNPGPGFTISYDTLLREADFAGFVTAIQPTLRTVEPISAQNTSDSPSVYQIMVDTVELSMRKYQFNPSKDDIYFTTVLLYYSLRNMGLDAEVGGFMTGIGGLLQAARTQSMNDFLAQVNIQYPIGGGAPLAPAAMNNYLALRYVYEAFNDPTSEAFRELTGVRVNPAPLDIVTDKNIEKMKKTLKASIDAFETQITATGAGSSAEKVVKAMEDLILPSIIKQMQTKDPNPLFTYVGKKEQPSDKIIDTVNHLFGECQSSVTEHIQELGKLAEILASDPSAADVVGALTVVKGTSDKLDLLDKTATAMDDFMKFLPANITKKERRYVSAIKDFMICIADDLYFDSETIGDLTTEAKDLDTPTSYGKRRAFTILSGVITELKEMADVVKALDETIKPYEDYSASSVDSATRYSNSAKIDMARPGKPYSHLKKQLVKAHTKLLQAVSSLCGSTTDTENVLKNLVNSKTNIPVRQLSSGAFQPNPFESFVRSRESSVLVQALHKAGNLSINSKKDYEDLFEGQVAYGRVLLDFYAEMADEAGFANEATFYRQRNKMLESLINGLYKKYEGRTKAGNATKLLARDTFQLIKASGKGAVFGTGALVGGTVGAAVGGTVLGASAAKEVTTAGLGAMAGTGLTVAGAVIGAGSAIGAYLISGGITAAGLAGSLGISAVVSTHTFFKKRREIYKKIREDPAFIQNAIDTATAKQQAKLSEMSLAQNERERRGLQLEADLLFLGAQRLRSAQKAAEAELRANKAAAAAAEVELDTIETEIATLTLTMQAEGMLREEKAAERAFEREEERLNREEERVIAEQKRQEARSLRDDTVADLKIDLKALNRKKALFENDHRGKNLNLPLTPEMRRKHGGVPGQTAANRLTELTNEIAGKKQEIAKLQGRV